MNKGGAGLRIVVVGGGTDGWISALFLHREMLTIGGQANVTVIEPTRTPTIDAGEGTTAAFKGAIGQLGLDEIEFLRKTRATIKYGIRHRDWRRVGHSYDGPIDNPHVLLNEMGKENPTLLSRYCISRGRSVAEAHLFARLMERLRAPFVVKDGKKPVPISYYDFAYHFDQALVGEFLREKAEGIRHIDADVSSAVKDASTGFVTDLVLEDGSKVPADLVIDCTGFRRLIIGTEMGAEWDSYRKRLPVNRTMPFWLPLGDDKEIPPFTLAWAQSAGWMWQIPTQDRMECGYVYSDEFISPDEAKAEIEGVLGREIEPRNDMRINSGRLDKAWIGNCVAFGSSQSFFEPLEATSIHGTMVQLAVFCTNFLQQIAAGKYTKSGEYNSFAAGQVDDFCTFIGMHYVSQRRDTPFWRYVAAECRSAEIVSRLELWRHVLPDSSHFNRLPHEFPHIDEHSYYPVLDGLGLLSKALARTELARQPRQRALARKAVAELNRAFRLAATQASGHREFLNSCQNLKPTPAD